MVTDWRIFCQGLNNWATTWQNQQTQINLGIRQVWSESLLSAWRKVKSLATHKADREDSDQTGPRLIESSLGTHAILLVLSWDGSGHHYSVSGPLSSFGVWAQAKYEGTVSFQTGRSGQTVVLKEQTDQAGRGRLIGCATAWYVDGLGFDPHVRQHSFVEFGHEIISTAIFSLQDVQLSVTGERMCTKYW